VVRPFSSCSGSTTRFCSRPLAAMLAVRVSISALVCGVLRTFFGDVLSRLRGMNRTSPLLGFSFLLAIVFSFKGRVLRAKAAHEPLPFGENGVSKGMGGGREGDHPPEGPRGTSGSAQAEGAEDRGYPAAGGRMPALPFPARGAEPLRNSNKQSAPQALNKVYARDRYRMAETRDPACGIQGAR
jgi:hypothetical protein